MLPIQQFTPPVLAEMIRRQPSSDGRTRLAWQVAVGTKLARATSVQLAGGVLTVSATDPRWVAEIQAAREVVLRRLQDLLGPKAVSRISLERPRGPKAARRHGLGPEAGNPGSENRSMSAEERKLFK
jgi:hypothetical protein